MRESQLRVLSIMVGVPLVIVMLLAMVNQLKGGQRRGAVVDEKPLLEVAIENRYFSVRFHESDRKYAELVLRESEISRELVLAFLGGELSGVTFFIYSNLDEMRDAANTSLNPKAQGLSDMKGIHLVEYADRKLITHELVHTAIRRRLYGSEFGEKTGPGTTSWLEEGIASYVPDPNYDWSSAIKADLRNGLVPQLEDIPNNVRGKLANWPYTVGPSIIQYLEKGIGPGTTKKIIDRLADGKLIDQAFEDVLGIPLDEFEARWREYVLSK